MKNNQTGELPEVRWDRLLRIKTAGRDDSSADQYRYPYEPTPYSVLERLAGSGWIRKGNILLDYGCVTVHVFSAEAREFYSLERLWHDGKPVDLSGVLTAD